MYPLNHFALFPPFPQTNRVFVITAFDERLSKRFTDVIAPAIERIAIDGQSLSAFRVNQSKIGDSILIEILREIQRARLIFADVSALDQLNGRPIRNPNALYELGIAHATRLPEEVLIFRSDDLPLSFDIANVRVRRFDPESEPDEARKTLSEAIIEAFRSIDLTRQLAVERAAHSLDLNAWFLLAKAVSAGPIEVAQRYKMGEMAEKIKEHLSIGRLLDAGLLAVEYRQFTADLVHADMGQVHRFACTPFGRAVAEFTMKNRFTPEALTLVQPVERTPDRATPDAPAASDG